MNRGKHKMSIQESKSFLQLAWPSSCFCDTWLMFFHCLASVLLLYLASAKEKAKAKIWSIKRRKTQACKLGREEATPQKYEITH